MTTEAKVKRKFFVVSHTHWDREWYQPFEAFRARLVRMMDALIDLFESDPEFKHFAMDGQTVPLDDYLEIRPDRRETIERLVRDGRLLIGPNYMLPDEFLIGGEAWVRNLMTGIRSSRCYGGVMNVGYSPDAFGHIMHLPAILRGFGIDSVVIWRGVGRQVDVSEFRWAAPDGSEVLVVHFPTPNGYGYMAQVPEDQSALANVLHNMRSALEPYATTRCVLVPNGTDHLPARAGLSGVIRAANEIMPDAEMVHSTYPEFVAAVRKELGSRYDELPVVTGEFRDSSRSNIIAGVLSTRIWLKQRYAECENLLARYAEPLVAWSHLAHGERDGDRAASDKALLAHAWRLLLQNGPHDSVTGCSVDPVYEDVGLRFTRVEQIAESLIFDAQREIMTRAAPPGQETIAVFNPENGPRTDFCTVRLVAGSDGLPAHAMDEAGNEVPLQIIERGLYSPLDPRERVVTGFVATDIPAFGYRTFTLSQSLAGQGTSPDANRLLQSPGGQAPADANRLPQSAGGQVPPDTNRLSQFPVGQGPSPDANGASIENDFFRVTAQPDGSLTVEDKRSGHILRGLNRFEDSGDGGDEYTYSPPEADEFVRKPSGVSAQVTETGPARWTLEVRQVYSLPARISGDRRSRSEERSDCEILSRVRLYPGVARIDIETEVDNRAEDHRLRVLFPSGIVSEHSHSEQHFGVIKRPTKPVEYDSTWYERPVNTYPQKTFTDLSDSARGLMIANRGLPEYEVLTEDDGTATFALTLLRCVSWLSRDDLPERPGHAGPGIFTPGAQMPGRWRFEYSIIPHEGAWQNAYAEAHRFARPLRAARISRGTGEWPREKSLLSLEGDGVVLSAIKPAEDGEGTVVRAYNIGDAEASGAIALSEPHGKVLAVDLNEEHPKAAKGRLELRSNQIVTMRFEAER